MKTRIIFISENQNLRHVKEELEKARLVSVDTETYGAGKKGGLDPLTGKIRLVQISTVEMTFVLDMQRLAKAAVAEFLLPLMYDRHTVKVAHNWKFDLEFMVTYFGLDLRRVQSIFCTRVAHKLVSGGLPVRSSLKDVAWQCLELNLDKSEQLWDWSGNIYKEQIVYAGLDSAVLLPIYRVLAQAIVDNNLQTVSMLEMRTTPAVASLELNGLRLDKAKWQELAERDKEQLYLIEQSLRHEFGFGDVNLNSDKQMWKLLSDMTGLNVTSRARGYIEELIETYEPRTDLFGARPDYRPALLKYLEFTDFSKDVTTYGFNFLNFIHPKTGRIHSNFNQNDTNTQRFSNSNPPLQTIPRESDRRACFIPADGKKFVRFDYSQIELRIMAFFTRDEMFLRAFNEKIDLHRLTAATEHNIPFDEVPDNLRQDMKPINFGIPYGMGADGLATKLGIDRDDAAGRLKRYFDNHPWITSWHRKQFGYFKTYNCVRTSTGRVRALPHWRIGDEHEWKAKQAAKNFPIQSTSADITKLAICKVFYELPEAELVLTVHDENVYEVDEEIAEEIAPEIAVKMKEAAEEIIPEIPIELDGGVTDCWKKD